MTNKFLIVFIICFGIIPNIHGQSLMDMPSEVDKSVKTEFESALRFMNVSMNLTPQYTASQNEGLIYPAGDEYVPTINQRYGHESASGKTELNVIFSGVHSILTHSDGGCKILLYPSGEYVVRFGLTQTTGELFNIINFAFNRIKKDFRYGIPNKSATIEEIEELDMMVEYYPKEQAKEMFNADEMLMYPLSLRGNAFEDKYTRCRAVMVSKNEMPFFLYFLMTDESAKNFDQYLKDLSGSFMYN